MTTKLLCQGFAVGMLAAIPLGPMGILCVRRTMAYGRISGLVSASGLTLAVALWCIVAVQGLSAVAQLMAGRELMFTASLGLFLIVAGTMGLLKVGRQTEPLDSTAYGSFGSHFFSCLMGAVLNPVMFVTLTAVLALLGVGTVELSPQGILSLAVAVFAGGITLWICLTHVLTMTRERLGHFGCARINKTLNVCILILGIAYLLRPFLSAVAG